jgi:hypothetical protein
MKSKVTLEKLIVAQIIHSPIFMEIEGFTRLNAERRQCRLFIWLSFCEHSNEHTKGEGFLQRLSASPEGSVSLEEQ